MGTGSPKKSSAEQGTKPASHCYTILPPNVCAVLAREEGLGEESLHLLKMAEWLFEPFLAPTHVIGAGFLLSLKLTNGVYHIKPIYSGYMREEEG